MEPLTEQETARFIEASAERARQREYDAQVMQRIEAKLDYIIAKIGQVEEFADSVTPLLANHPMLKAFMR